MWHTLISKTSIPSKDWDSIKNILYEDKLIVRTGRVNDYGDLVRGLPSISRVILGLKKEAEINEWKINGDGNIVIQNSANSNAQAFLASARANPTSETNNNKTEIHARKRS